MDMNRYIGIPFEWGGRSFNEVDCYGLAVLAYREEKGIDLPDYAYMKDPELRRLFGAGLHEPCWRQVSIPAPFDLVVFRINGHPLHCGLVVEGNDFIHARSGICSCVERLDGPSWRNRVWGFYRHVQ